MQSKYLGHRMSVLNIHASHLCFTYYVTYLSRDWHRSFTSSCYYITCLVVDGCAEQAITCEMGCIDQGPGVGELHQLWQRLKFSEGEEEEDWESVSADSLDSEMPHIEDLTSSMLIISTEHWEVVQCLDFDCVELGPHTHRVYDPEVPKQNREVVMSRLCNRVDCPDATSVHLHTHQGSGRRGTSDGVQVCSPRLQQGEVLPTRSGGVAVVVDEFDGRLPYGRFACAEKACKYSDMYEQHVHFRNGVVGEDGIVDGA
jgi:hypothetical protein